MGTVLSNKYNTRREGYICQIYWLKEERKLKQKLKFCRSDPFKGNL